MPNSFGTRETARLQGCVIHPVTASERIALAGATEGLFLAVDLADGR
jgi:hypothetical protein